MARLGADINAEDKWDMREMYVLTRGKTMVCIHLSAAKKCA
ncbi:MAG: hypothetical protein OJF51_000478 [Nitrospira sp.]|nr:MAG: hypothetical protein OJF51_000478 [Nitrospira sp.]